MMFPFPAAIAETDHVLEVKQRAVENIGDAVLFTFESTFSNLCSLLTEY